ncbi:MAG: hypothetical protein GF388_05095 [Candidatus Aegiribacteria sp.]|nr:hypothetical protein [Candidatus Aegiribacteria sp.]MBD3294592.1 hypothetical protein [Candidatus Fermentibacteria bacterium]
MEFPEKISLERSPIFRGEMYAVTSNFTYSAAASLAAMFNSFNPGTLIGEPTGGNASSYGDVFSFSLPNTKLRCRVSNKFFVGPDGSRTPEPTYPDFDTREFGIEINSSDAINDIMGSLDKFSVGKDANLESHDEPVECTTTC